MACAASFSSTTRLAFAALILTPLIASPLTIESALIVSVAHVGSDQRVISGPDTLTKGGSAICCGPMPDRTFFGLATATTGTAMILDVGKNRIIETPKAEASAQTNHAFLEGRASAAASLAYDVEVVQLLSLPGSFSLPPLPVTVRVAGFAEVEKDGTFTSAGASGFARFFRGALPDVILPSASTSGSLATSVIEDIEFNLGLGTPVQVLLAAAAHAQGQNAAQGSARATAQMDPVFSFNQKAFDEIALAQGFPSFELERYFAFAQSPLLSASPVPEPTSMILVLAGGLALSTARIRRRTPASHH